jgi:hypothetical protein
MSDDTMKMPEPIMVPTTRLIAASGPIPWTNPPGDSDLRRDSGTRD